MSLQPPLPPPLRPKNIKSETALLAKDYFYESVPGAAKSRYYSLVARRYSPDVAFWLLVTLIPMAFILFLLFTGPNLRDTPNLVAGKLSTINSFIFILAVINVWMFSLKTRRVAVPRSRYM